MLLRSIYSIVVQHRRLLWLSCPPCNAQSGGLFVEGRRPFPLALTSLVPCQRLDRSEIGAVAACAAQYIATARSHP